MILLTTRLEEDQGRPIFGPATRTTTIYTTARVDSLPVDVVVTTHYTFFLWPAGSTRLHSSHKPSQLLPRRRLRACEDRGIGYQQRQLTTKIAVFYSCGFRVQAQGGSTGEVVRQSMRSRRSQ